MYVRKNNLNFIVQDNEPYTAIDGTKYPCNYPKDDITELAKVVATEQPKADVIIGYHIDETYKQVWETRSFTEQENAKHILNEATMLLDKSDMVAIRCFKAGVEFPQEWKSYVETLRSIVNGIETTIPSMPEYPQGS